jgi:hypothetical protein
MNSLDFLLIKVHLPAYNSPQLGYTTPGYASKRRQKQGSQPERGVFGCKNQLTPTNKVKQKDFAKQ